MPGGSFFGETWPHYQCARRGDARVALACDERGQKPDSRVGLIPALAENDLWPGVRLGGGCEMSQTRRAEARPVHTETYSGHPPRPRRGVIQ